MSVTSWWLISRRNLSRWSVRQANQQLSQAFWMRRIWTPPPIWLNSTTPLRALPARPGWPGPLSPQPEPRVELGLRH